MEHDEDANGQLEPKELKLSDEEFLRRDRNQDNRVTQPELVDIIRSEAESDLRLGALVFAATNRLRLANGDVRLVGWTSHECEGLTVEPVAAQKKSAALVVVHLRRGSMIRPLADINAKLDFPSLMDEGTDPIIPGVEEFDNDPNQPPGGTPGQPLRRIN